ncbi:MAG: Hsp70 family protein [Acidimicrobiales bacterium]
MAYQLGIDLGTTYSAAAVHRDGRVEVVGLGDRAAVVPSVVFLREGGDVLTGESANRRGFEEPDRVAREFKRRLGDPTPLYVGGAPWAPHLLMARLLRWIIDRVAEREGAYPDAIAVTHPANWGAYKVDLLKQAVRHAGFGDYPVAYLTEPQAAAMHYATQERVAPGSVVAVYDLGGGTFDAAVMRRTPNGTFEIIGQPEGIEHLGGIDFDAAVLRHVDQVLDGAVSGLDANDPEAVSAVARLRAECVDAKEALSSDVDVSVPVSLPAMRHSVRLTRSEFEAMVRPVINETIIALRRAVHSAGVAPDHVQSVLLVGGSSRIPLVAQMVSAELGRPLAVDAHPKHAIAQGAAVAAAQLAGEGTADTVTVVETTETEIPVAAAGVPVAAGPREASTPAVTGAPPPAGPGGWAPTASQPSWQQPAPPAHRRKGAMIGAGVAAVVIVGAVTVFAATRGGGDNDPPATTIDDTTGLPAVRDDGDAWVVPMQVAGVGSSGLVKIDREGGTAAVLQNWAHSSSDHPVVTDDAVWLAATDDDGGLVLDRFDRTDGTHLGSTPLDAEAEYEFPRAFRGRDSLWVAARAADDATSVIFKVDEQSAEVTASLVLDLAFFPDRVVTQGDRLFVIASDPQGGQRVLQISGDTSRTDAVFPGTFGPDAMAVVGDEVWALSDAEGVINRFDADDLETGERIALPEQNPFGLTVSMLVTEETVTIAGTDDQSRVKLFQIDRRTEEVETIEPEEIPPSPSASFAIGPDGEVWVYGQGQASEGEDPAPSIAARIEDGEVATTEIPPSASSFPTLEVFDDVVVINEVTNLGPVASPRAYLVDRERVELVDTVPIDLYPTLATFADGRVFITDLTANRVHVIEDDEVVDVVDTERPAWPATPVGSEVWTMTQDGGLSVFDADDPEDSQQIFTPTNLKSPLLVDGDQVWMGRGSQFFQLDAANHEVVGSLETDRDSVFFIDQPALISTETLAFGAIWTDAGEGVRRIDTATGAAADAVIPGSVVDITRDAQEMWATNTAGQVFRLDPTTGAQLAAGGAGEGMGKVVLAGEEVWYIDYDGDAVRRIDREFASGNITAELDDAPGGALFAAGSLWVTVEKEDQVVRINPENGEIEATIDDVGRRPAYIVGDDEQVWVALQGEPTMVRLDPETDEVAERVELER